MSEREPITWELRLFLADPYKEWVPNKKQELQDALSAIDAVHAALEAENAELRARVAALDESADSMHETDAWKLGYDEGFASADDWLGQHEDAMAEHGWVRLPVDVNDEPIRIGDVMEWPTTGETFEVVGIGDGTLFYVEDGNECADWTGASTKRHHHEQTVEDVLREMHAELDEVTALYVGEAIDSDERDRDEARIFAEYAAKLRLAGDAE